MKLGILTDSNKTNIINDQKEIFKYKLEDNLFDCFAEQVMNKEIENKKVSRHINSLTHTIHKLRG